MSEIRVVLAGVEASVTAGVDRTDRLQAMVYGGRVGPRRGAGGKERWEERREAPEPLLLHCNSFPTRAPHGYRRGQSDLSPQATGRGLSGHLHHGLRHPIVKETRKLKDPTDATEVTAHLIHPPRCGNVPRDCSTYLHQCEPPVVHSDIKSVRYPAFTDYPTLADCARSSRTWWSAMQETR